MFQMNDLPTYDPQAVLPLRKELTDVGVQELLTAEEVDNLLDIKDETVLVMVNSVCGCAAGNARPGLSLALQNRIIPDHLATVFAGMEKAAVRRFRDYTHLPPSSPFIALMKNKQVLYVLERSDIESRTAEQVAQSLITAFGEFCSKQGPSIPKEKFAELKSVNMCGSQIPLA